MRETMMPFMVDFLLFVFKGLEKNPGRIKNQKSQDHPDHNIVKIS